MNTPSWSRVTFALSRSVGQIGGLFLWDPEFASNRCVSLWTPPVISLLVSARKSSFATLCLFHEVCRSVWVDHLCPEPWNSSQSKSFHFEIFSLGWRGGLLVRVLGTHCSGRGHRIRTQHSQGVSLAIPVPRYPLNSSSLRSFLQTHGTHKFL